MTDFSANRKKNDLGVLQLNLDMSKYYSISLHTNEQLLV